MNQIKVEKPKKPLMTRLFGKHLWQLYVIAALPVALLIIFNYIPMAGVQMAFRDFTFRGGIWGSPWVGLRFFNQLFDSPIFPMIMRNTVILAFQSLIIGFPFPILLALAYNEVSNTRLKKSLQTIAFAPYFISTVVLVSIITQIFSFRFGVVNEVINLFGGDSIDFFGSDWFFRPAYVWSGIWQMAGFSSILYLAALSSVDPGLYDSAAIDGASRLQKVWYIDLPCIMPIIVITFILNAGGILNIGFERVFLMQNPLNYGVSEVISTYVYKVGIQQAQWSFSAAVGLFNAVINCLVLVTVNFIARRLGDTSLF